MTTLETRTQQTMIQMETNDSLNLSQWQWEWKDLERESGVGRREDERHLRREMMRLWPNVTGLEE